MTATVEAPPPLSPTSRHAIEAEDLGVQYSLRFTKKTTLRQSFMQMFSREPLEPFWALRNVSFSLLRGVASDSFAGTHVAIANADYRVPLWRPERGIGPLPVFLRTVHASVIADAGQIWTARFSRRDLKYSAGAELSADVVLGYALPLTFTAPVVTVRADGAAPTRFTVTGEVRPYTLRVPAPPAGQPLVVHLAAPTWCRPGEPAEQGVRVDRRTVAPAR